MTASRLTVTQAAFEVTVSTERIRQACASGALPASDISSRADRHVWRIDVDDLKAWAAAGYPTVAS